MGLGQLRIFRCDDLRRQRCQFVPIDLPDWDGDRIGGWVSGLVEGRFIGVEDPFILGPRLENGVARSVGISERLR
jgi:hypothetical protein